MDQQFMHLRRHRTGPASCGHRPARPTQLQAIEAQVVTLSSEGNSCKLLILVARLLEGEKMTAVRRWLACPSSPALPVDD